MQSKSNAVVILTRTAMTGGVCVGAYDVDNQRMIRLLDSQAKRLALDVPYQIGQQYSMTYANKYNLSFPHVEDVAVYEARYQGDYNNFGALVNQLTHHALDLNDLFESKLQWENSGFALPSNPPSYSVQIATLNCDLIKNGDYFEQKRWGMTLKKIKYVGAEPIGNLPNKISSGTKIRFSLARFWDKGDGVQRAYLQISGIY